MQKILNIKDSFKDISFLKSKHWFFVFIVTQLVFMIFSGVFHSIWGSSIPKEYCLENILMQPFVLLIISLFVLKTIGVDFKKTWANWEVNLKRDVLLTVGYFGFYLFLIYLLSFAGYPWGLFPDKPVDSTFKMIYVNKLLFVVVFFSTVLIAPIAEEVFYKRLLYVGIRREGMSVLKSITLCSLLFALIHPMMNFIQIIFFGLISYYMYEKHKRLFANIMLHSIINFTAIYSNFF